MNSFRDTVINQMHLLGWEYDDINSSPHHLCFNSEQSPTAFPFSFKSWREADDWVRNVVTDLSF